MGYIKGAQQQQKEPEANWKSSQGPKLKQWEPQNKLIDEHVFCYNPKLELDKDCTHCEYTNCHWFVHFNAVNFIFMWISLKIKSISSRISSNPEEHNNNNEVNRAAWHHSTFFHDNLCFLRFLGKKKILPMKNTGFAW